MSIEEWYVDNILAESEGTTAHIDRNAVGTGSGTLATAAYGVTSRSGLTQKANESNRDFAIRAAKKYFNDAKNSLGSTLWDSLPDTLKIMAADLEYNTGTSNYSGFKRELRNKNWEQAAKQTLDIVGGAEKRTDAQGNQYEQRIIMGGLGNRRARLYNLAAKDQGFAEIAGSNTVNTGPNSSKMVYYFDDSTTKEFDFTKPVAQSITDASFYQPLDVNKYIPDLQYGGRGDGQAEVQARRNIAVPTDAEEQALSAALEAESNEDYLDRLFGNTVKTIKNLF